MTLDTRHGENASRTREAPRTGLVREVFFSARLKRQRVRAAIAGALLFYIVIAVQQYYLSDYSTQSFDQRMYIISSHAFAAGDLNPDLHWYPLLYSLAGAPFVPLLPRAPFFVVNLASAVAIAILFVRLCSIYQLSALVSVAALVISLAMPVVIFLQFVLPWNTIPVAALTMACLYIVIRPQPLSMRAALTLATCGSMVPLLRPVDALPLLPIAVAFMWRARKDVRLILEGAALTGAIFGAYFMLHFAIYGFDAPPYIALSKGVGFDLGRFADKAYAIIVDPIPLYGVGQGIVERAPWTILAPYGAVVMAHRYGWRGMLVPSLATISFVTYIAYADLTPYSFWLQFNVHYLSGALLLAAIMSGVAAARIWAQPGTHLIGAMLFTGALVLIGFDSGATPASRLAVADASTIALSCDRCATYDAVEIAGVRIDEKTLYQTSLTTENRLHRIVVDGAVMRNIRDFRMIPQRDGVRIVFDRPQRARMVVIRFAVPHRLARGASAQFLDGGFGIRGL